MIKQNPSSAPTARLFLALWPGTDVAAALRASADMQMMAGGAGACPVAPNRLHLTLQFLGAVPRQRLAELDAALALPFREFELRFDHFERWPRGLVVALPQAVPAALTRLHGELGDLLQRLGLRTDTRAFRPHVAVARRYSGAVAAGEWPAVVRWTVHGYCLVESRAPLGGGYLLRRNFR